MTRLAIPTEADEQAALVAWLNAKRIPFLHVPNESRSHVRHRANLKRLGLQPGAPDIIILRQASAFRGPVAIEMKRQRGGKVSPAQKRMHEVMRDEGWYVCVAHGAAEAMEFLLKLGIGGPHYACVPAAQRTRDDIKW